MLTIIALYSCSPNDKSLEDALVFAGDNRAELENVLTHYQNESEKLEAARFLIRNMPHWYSYEGWQLDSVRQVLASGNYSKQVVEKWKNYSYYSLPKVYDAHVIKADYLIENIDMAFDTWKKYPWNKELGFDDFCELILPYRIADEPLSRWRKLYHDHYATMLDSVYKGRDVVEACRVVCEEINKHGVNYFTEFVVPHHSGEFLFHHPVGYCRESCDLTMYAMRACGIPVATEHFIYSPDYQHFHSWTTLRDTTGLFIPFEYERFAVDRKKNRDDRRKKGKVYRYCFGEQRSLLSEVEEDEKVPPFFYNRRVKDVTANYFGENSVTVPVQTKEDNIYLGVFSPGGWIPIDVALRKKEQVTFCNLEPNIIYVPLYSEGRRCHAAGYPFIYKDGKTELLIPDSNQREHIALTRKMSMSWGINSFLYRAIIGAKIEASNSPSFANADLLYQFKDTLTTNYYELKPYVAGRKYKYIRYASAVGKRMEVAEFSICQDTLCKQKIAMHRTNEIEPVGAIDNMTDGNLLTYFESRDTTCYVAYKFDTPTSIARIVFSPRNDDNFVWPGELYELFYQDGIQGWRSLGTQTAIGRELNYKVPKNALLWLRNLTKGREEQIFIYRNGKQCFTVDIK